MPNSRPPHHLRLLTPSPAPTPTGSDQGGIERIVRKAVITVTSIAGPTGSVAPAKSEPTKIPIGPIVGGIVAGVAAVLIVGGIWFWCHRKAEKEKEEARQRAAMRAARKNGTARPTLIKNKSTVSETSMEKDAGSSSHHGGRTGKAPPVPAIPSQYLVSKHGPAGQQPGGHGHEGGYDRYGPVEQGRYQAYGGGGGEHEYYSANASTEMATHGTSPTSSTGSHPPPVIAQPRPTVPPPVSSGAVGSGSGGDRRSRAQQRIDAANAAKEREAALAAANPIGRYAPARPSPLRAEERKDQDDEAVPKWGSKPFRSANPAGSSAAAASVTLAPPVDTPQGSRDQAVSGEWGVAYSDVDDGAGAFEHDDYDARSDGRKSTGAGDVGRQATGYAYDPSTSARGRVVSGGTPDVYAQQYRQQQQEQQQQQHWQAQDPYAEARYQYQTDEDPYAPSPARRGGY